MTDFRTEDELKEFRTYVPKLQVIFKDLSTILSRCSKVALYSEMLELKHKLEQAIQDINLDLRQREATYVDTLKSALARACQEIEEAHTSILEWEIKSNPDIKLQDQAKRIDELREQATLFKPSNFELR